MVTASELSRRRWYFIQHLSKEEKKMFAELATLYEVGTKMKCQELIGPYIVDFTLPYKMLAIEIDDPAHKYHKKYDENRNWYLESIGFFVVHFTNKQVMKNMTKVKKEIQSYPYRKRWGLYYPFCLKREAEELKHPGQLKLL
jgi:very-short-patch-repair endonuclease